MLQFILWAAAKKLSLMKSVNYRKESRNFNRIRRNGTKIKIYTSKWVRKRTENRPKVCKQAVF